MDTCKYKDTFIKKNIFQKKHPGGKFTDTFIQKKICLKKNMRVSLQNVTSLEVILPNVSNGKGVFDKI